MNAGSSAATAQPQRRGQTVSFGQVLGGIKPPKEFHSGQPVWRNSYYEGQMEARIWRSVGIGKQRGTKRGGQRFAGAVLKAARRLDRLTRIEGKVVAAQERREAAPGIVVKRRRRNGMLGEAGLAVLEYLYQVVDYATGRLEPAIATIAENTGFCYTAVHEALCTLRDKGFVQWIRRSRPTENRGFEGPQVEQITNAYVLTLPAELERYVRGLLNDWSDAQGMSDCERWRREDHKREFDAMVAKLSAAGFHKDFWSGDRLAGESLGRIAALLDAKDRQERESLRTREIGRSF